MNLRQLRLERNLSQQDLESISRVSRTTIHRVEHGQQKPHKSTIIKLARALETSPEQIAPELFTEPDKPPAVKLTRDLMEEILPYVKKVARRLALNTGDAEDLEAAGREGIFEASRKYDPGRGVTFVAYARWLSNCRVKDEARRLYRKHPGYGLEAQGIEPWTY